MVTVAESPTSSSSGPSTPTRYSTEENLLRNSADDSVPYIVQKYGGTSVGKSLDSITSIVGSYLSDARVVVVCSARSSQTKALGTTNLLLQASREALQPASARAGSQSGYQTPLYPKRVGSGYFSQSMISSLSSLKDADRELGRSSSPSPFQRISSQGPRSRSPTESSGPETPTPNGNGAGETFEPAFNATVDTIKRGHLDAARQALSAGPLRRELEDEIERDCEALRSFLNAAHIIDEISQRSQDSIIGTGERLACKIVAAALRDRGIDSELVVLDNIVDASMNAATDALLTSATGDQGVAQLGQVFYDELAKRLGERLRDCGQRVPVVTGFFGPVPGSLLAQIGRGYTDLCAALCAVGVQAAELQVWKEVDGIFTADPRKVVNARLVPSITPDEAAELTYYGSEVIHPFTMEQVIRAKIPIRIKNVENPKGSGTIILPELDPENSAEGIDRLPTAVTIKDRIIVLNIHSNRKTISHGFLARIFGTLDRAGVVVDLISTSEVHVSMAMQDFGNARRLERLVKDLEKIGEITISYDMAILSLVGRNMRHAIGSASLMFSALARAQINLEMISQGASEINISCVIDNKDAVKALNVIHDSCLGHKPVGVLSGKGRSKALSRATVNPAVISVEYAVRGELSAKADDLSHRLADGEKLPFERIIYANIGNPQERELKQKPLTYWRQVAALVEYPELMTHPAASEMFPADVMAKAAQLVDEFGSVGAYTGSKGSLPIRKRVAKFLEKRDGFPADPEQIILTGGATPGVAMVMDLALCPGDGVLIPIPQYPLYTATLSHLQATAVPYQLSEKKGWALDLASLKAAVAGARQDASLRKLKALVVINPGNPTGSCLSEADMREIVQLCYDESLLLLADEVYQNNVYRPEQRPFVSFKKVLRSMPEPVASGVELVSLHSISKGVSGECGRRGGYLEAVNLDPEVDALLLKMASINLCAPVQGQVGVDLLVSPPPSGAPSHATFADESAVIHEGMKSRSAYMAECFNKLEGIECQPADGAMYLFPRLRLPPAAVQAAAKAGKAADVFYALALLDATGICSVAGSGFGQEDGTYHLRVTALCPGVEDMMARIEKFHRGFMAKYA